MTQQVCMIAYTNYSTDARVRREAETLARHGSKVVFLSLSENATPVQYELNGVTVRELPIHKYRGKNGSDYILSYCKFLLAATGVCTKLFFQRQIEVVHVHNMPDFLVFAGLVPRLFGKKLILDIHDSIPETYSSKFGKFSKLTHRLLCLEESVCCRVAHRVICVNDVQREVLVQRGIPREKTSLVLNVPDPNIFRFNPKGMDASSENGDSFNLVYHGIIEHMLGIDLAIQGVARLIDKIPGLHLYILGSGADFSDFEDLAKRLEVDERIHFSKKYFPVESLPDLLKGMDVGIIPNRRNAATDLMLPVKLLEYVGIGIPVVTARLQAIEHYFSENMVSYFEPGDVESMTRAIFDLYKNRVKRRQQVTQASLFLERFGWEKHQRELLNLYRNLINPRQKNAEASSNFRGFQNDHRFIQN
jgi:glycosyltransferase involved in cell wall biosynthesis